MTAPTLAGSAAGKRTLRIAFVLLFLLNLLNYADRYLLPGVQTMVQREFLINDAQLGALTNAFFITYMLAAPMTGWLGDRFRRKPLLVASVILWSLATLMTAWVHSYASMYFRHAVVGIGEATFGIFAPAILCDLVPEQTRTRILSAFYVAIPLGGALGYAGGGVLGSLYGWRMPFLIAAIPGIVIAILYAIYVPEPVRGSTDTLAPSFERTHFFGLFRNAAFWYATLGMAMLVFSMGGISTWLPTFMERRAGYSPSTAGLLSGGITAFDGIVGTLLGGWIASGLAPKYLYRIPAWAALGTIPLAAIAFFGPTYLLLPSIFLAIFVLFLHNGPLNTAIVNSIGGGMRSTAIAVNLFIIHALGDAVSPWFIGYISDRSNLATGLAATLVTLLIASVLLMLGSRHISRNKAEAAAL